MSLLYWFIYLWFELSDSTESVIDCFLALTIDLEALLAESLGDWFLMLYLICSWRFWPILKVNFGLMAGSSCWSWWASDWDWFWKETWGFTIVWGGTGSGVSWFEFVGKPRRYGFFWALLWLGWCFFFTMGFSIFSCWCFYSFPWLLTGLVVYFLLSSLALPVNAFMTFFYFASFRADELICRFGFSLSFSFSFSFSDFFVRDGFVNWTCFLSEG